MTDLKDWKKAAEQHYTWMTQTKKRCQKDKRKPE